MVKIILQKYCCILCNIILYYKCKGINLYTFLMRYNMTPDNYRRLTNLITLYGSAKFWAGANNNESYDKFVKDAESYYKEILAILYEV